MKKYNLNKFIRGWIIGNFDPAVLKIKKFEFGIKRYKKGDKETKHYHAIADEITVIISGKYKMNGSVLKADDIVWISPKEAVDFQCLRDGATAVIKIPSVPNDKYACKK